MIDTKILLYITGELALLLLLICGFLFWHSGRLRKLIRQLEGKILSLRKALGKAKKEATDALQKLAEKEKIKPRAYLDYLDDEIEITKELHQSLNPDRDIVLDITPDAPLERQAASLRHAFLIAEKEARYAGEDDSSDWDVLQGKFQQIIQFYESLGSAGETAPAEEGPVDVEIETDATGGGGEEEIANYRKRIENLERFKQLFFDMEKKWEQAKGQADDYYQQLMDMGKNLGAGEDFDQVLEQYSKSFEEVERIIVNASGGEVDVDAASSEGAEDSQPAQPAVIKTIAEDQDEIRRLREMAIDQHKVITELKKQLHAAKSNEDKQQVILDLMEQIEKQERFLQEAETCTELIEKELSRTIQENQALREQLENVKDESAAAEEIARLEKAVEDLTEESKEMLATVASLEKENQQLIDDLESGSGTGEDTGQLKKKLSDVQQELLNLQAQHIELEERYLELKSK